MIMESGFFTIETPGFKSQKSIFTKSLYFKFYELVITQVSAPTQDLNFQSGAAYYWGYLCWFKSTQVINLFSSHFESVL